MNSAIIFLKNAEEKQLAKAPYLGGNILLHTIKQLKKVEGISDVYLVGADFRYPGTFSRKNVQEVLGELDKNGKTLMVSPLYPDMTSEDYARLLKRENACVAVCEHQICEAFMIPNNKINNFEKVQYEEVEIKDKVVKKYTLEDAYRAKNRNLDNIVVFGLSTSVELVEEVCNYLNIKPGAVMVNHFADGETLVELGESVRGKNIYVIQSTAKPVNESFMELLICLDALKRSSAGEVTCIIPYFGYARQDRKALPRQPITAKLVATLLETAGASRVVTFDLHAAQIQGFFDCPVDDLTVVPMMGQYFRRKHFDPDEITVVSPDHGGVKRARNLAEMLQCSIAIIDKRRPRANVCEACNIIGDVDGKDVIIVDDIIDTGGSLVAAANILKEHGANDIYVCVSHGIFSHNAFTRIQDSLIKEVVVTNTINHTKEELKECPKIKVLSIGWMLSKLILAVSGRTPVSEVYALYEDEPSKK